MLGRIPTRHGPDKRDVITTNQLEPKYESEDKQLRNIGPGRESKQRQWSCCWELLDRMNKTQGTAECLTADVNRMPCWLAIFLT